MTPLCIAAIVGGVILAFILLWVLAIIYVKLSIGVCTSENRIDKKVVIITGANSGIGLEAAKVLASRGARLILGCRNIQKAETAASEIRAENPGCQVSVKRLDLCSFQSIRHFAEEVITEEPRLDILVNNAGLVGTTFKLTEDGFEEVYQANYLGPFYLTELLLPLLKRSAPSRIVNTGSSGYILGCVSPSSLSHDVKTLNKPSGLRYGDTKLAMLMWTRGIADELKDSGVSINVLHPGVVATAIIAKQELNLSNLMFTCNIFTFGRTVKQGAQTIIHLCLDDEGQTITGKYWSECKPATVVKGRNDQVNRQVVLATREILGLK